MIRKIIKIGNSDGIVIPVSAMRAHKFKTGDQVEVILSPPGDIARRVEFLQDLEDFQKHRRQETEDTLTRPLL